jgi:hypothetical protein
LALSTEVLLSRPGSGGISWIPDWHENGRHQIEALTGHEARWLILCADEHVVCVLPVTVRRPGDVVVPDAGHVDKDLAGPSVDGSDELLDGQLWET